jgi:threonine dehydratase
MRKYRRYLNLLNACKISKLDAKLRYGTLQGSGKEAEKIMRGVFERTPLQKNEHLSAIYGADIWLKREDLSPVRSYKLRGAFNAMRKARQK